MTSALTSPAASRLAIDDDAIARAEAALRSLSSQFAEWLGEELAKLDASRRALPAGRLVRTDLDGIYTHAHDLKGLGTTYGFPLISRIAASLCRLLDDLTSVDDTALHLVDAHLDGVRRIVREDRREEDDLGGVRLAETLERDVAPFVTPTRS